MSIDNKKQNTFNPSFFSELKKAEESHFWFHVRRKWIFDSIRRFIPPPATLLEVGCGTGNVGSYLARNGYTVTGCEFFEEASEFSWPGFERVRADAGHLPFEENTFDVVGLFDVIEHLDDDLAALKEAGRVLRQGGVAVVTVPAGEELWSQVDAVACHRRRYTKERLQRVLSGALLDICKIDYMFMSLYFPLKLMRRKEYNTSDIFKINRVTNILMQGVFDTERMISKFVTLPCGTSLVAVARKKDSEIPVPFQF